jgi:plasmid stabilization system protein ParE
MARIVVTETARADLRAMILSHSLPNSTVERVRAALAPLAEFPRLGPGLEGRWRELRFILGPWPWMLIVYAWDETADEVAVVTIQDARSARAATGERRRRTGRREGQGPTKTG